MLHVSEDISGFCFKVIIIASRAFASEYFCLKTTFSFGLSSMFKDYDPFDEQKRESFFTTMDSVTSLSENVIKSTSMLGENSSDDAVRLEFETLLQVGMMKDCPSGKKPMLLSKPFFSYFYFIIVFPVGKQVRFVCVWWRNQRWSTYGYGRTT